MLNNDTGCIIDNELQEIVTQKILLNINVEIEVIQELLVEKGIVSRYEIDNKRNTVKNNPDCKPMYDYLNEAEKKLKQYMGDLDNTKTDTSNS